MDLDAQKDHKNAAASTSSSPKTSSKYPTHSSATTPSPVTTTSSPHKSPLLATTPKLTRPVRPVSVVLKPTPKQPMSFTLTLEQFQAETLEWHNYFRALHGAVPLTLNQKISKFANEWAVYLAATDKFEHRPEHEYGENIYVKWSSKKGHQVTGRDAVESWYREINDYEFGKEPEPEQMTAVGHFTQLVWLDSREVGIARARNANNKIYVVANYAPPGNYEGQHREQVKPQIFPT